MLLLMVPVLLLSACSKDDNDGTATVQFRLVDAPELYDEVNVHIIGVELFRPGGPVSLNTNVGIYNLLDYTNGNDTIIAADEIPVGKVNQFRLILGQDSNTIVKDGIVYPLSTPSAQQSGLKLNFNKELLADMEYVFWIDFDASKSVVETGSGDFILKPVLRMFADGQFGIISGTIQPATLPTAVQAISGTDTFSTFIDTLGGFQILGLDGGTYDVHVHPPTPLSDTLITDVDVVEGQNNNLGTISLN